VTDSWNIAGLLRDLTARDQHPAIIIFGEDGVATWDSATVADKALRLARGLRDAGVDRATGWRCGRSTPPGLDRCGPLRARGRRGGGADG
jgi:hypothetical protein